MIEYPACPFCFEALIFDGEDVMNYCYNCDSEMVFAMMIKDHEVDEPMQIVDNI